MTPVTWHGMTADYTEGERSMMRELAVIYPDEALMLHEIKTLLDATVIDTGARKLYAGAEPRPDQLRMDEAA